MEDEKIKEPETIMVNIGENYGDSCIDDSVSSVSSKSRKPEGYVEIYSIDKDGKKQKVGKNNLVVYEGREWIASRIVNVDNPDINTSSPEFISWFGIGDGGTPIGDPLVPNAPSNTMIALSNEVPMNNNDTTCADLRENGYFYKHPFDNVEFQQDESNGNRWLTTKITTTITTQDANGYNLNEAALYISSSKTGGHAGPFSIFSIVTFPSIVKDSTRQLVFYWYLYC